jgi:hypothetical protein
MPDPATKAEHFQNPSILEVILPKIDELKYGDNVIIEVDEKQIQLKNTLEKTARKKG